MCVYVYIFKHHFLRGVNHAKYLEISLHILPVYLSRSTHTAQSSGLCMEPITNQHPSRRMCRSSWWWAGVAKRRLLGRAEPMNLAI